MMLYLSPSASIAVLRHPFTKKGFFPRGSFMNVHLGMGGIGNNWHSNCIVATIAI